jgi:hypothetical protein
MTDLFGDLPTQVSLPDQIAEIERELGMRKRLYPNWIARGTLKQATADHQLRVMEAVLATLKGATP